MSLWLVLVMDKETIDEVDVGLCVVDGGEVDAKREGDAMVEALTDAGRGRCVYRAREIEQGAHYRLSGLIRTRRDR